MKSLFFLRKKRLSGGLNNFCLQEILFHDQSYPGLQGIWFPDQSYPGLQEIWFQHHPTFIAFWQLKYSNDLSLIKLLFMKFSEKLILFFFRDKIGSLEVQGIMTKATLSSRDLIPTSSYLHRFYRQLRSLPDKTIVHEIQWKVSLFRKKRLSGGPNNLCLQEIWFHEQS